MTIKIVTPQFKRPVYEPAPCAPPRTPEGWAALADMPPAQLRATGLRAWGRQFEATNTGPELWLFPHEWYDAIPDGFEIVDIFFKREQFKKGETDDDMRFGCLGFGILRNEDEKAGYR